MTRRRDYSWLVYAGTFVFLCLLAFVVWTVGDALGRWVSGQ